MNLTEKEIQRVLRWYLCPSHPLTMTNIQGLRREVDVGIDGELEFDEDRTIDCHRIDSHGRMLIGVIREGNEPGDDLVFVPDDIPLSVDDLRAIADKLDKLKKGG